MCGWTSLSHSGHIQDRNDLGRVRPHVERVAACLGCVQQTPWGAPPPSGVGRSKRRACLPTRRHAGHADAFVYAYVAAFPAASQCPRRARVDAPLSRARGAAARPYGVHAALSCEVLCGVVSMLGGLESVWETILRSLAKWSWGVAQVGLGMAFASPCGWVSGSRGLGVCGCGAWVGVSGCGCCAERLTSVRDSQCIQVFGFSMAFGDGRCSGFGLI